ncbi:alpha-ketoglutarate-dependent dioxygenase AlkB [Candidatus Kaiserbacteria bacterium]|nr:alpha-ketoglutarate-dependent dioxygenase AlkB [Candidatus Kaiserbacteria bacterium]
MPRPGGQQKLFDTAVHLPNGLVYRPDFITPDEEAELISYIEMLPLAEAEYGEEARGASARPSEVFLERNEQKYPEGVQRRYGEYHSQRRHFNFGWGYDFENKKFVPGPPLPPFLRMLQLRIGKWLDIPPRRVAEALINEYTPGAPLGWHRDNEAFEHIVGISLAGWARMRFRPLTERNEKKDPKKVISLELEPRSAYIMQKDVRWKWQHSVAATKILRYSITFRTLPKSIPLPTKRRR